MIDSVEMMLIGVALMFAIIASRFHYTVDVYPKYL